MAIESESGEGPRRGSGLPFGIVLAVVIVVTIGFGLLLRQITPPTRARSNAPRTAPEIQVEGWLNGPGPTTEDLQGKVIVVDAWAYWCGPCRASAPELVRLYETYRDRGVLFVGLTGEGAEADALNRRFLEVTGITWPNGYGATKPLLELRAEFIPQRWVIDRKYNIVWDEMSSESIETAIERALAEQP